MKKVYKGGWRKHNQELYFLNIECRSCGHNNTFTKQDVWNVAKVIIKFLF